MALKIPLALLFLLPALSCADRINRMTLTERCVYTARLSVAGYHYFLQGMSRSEVPIRWHGDETQNEVDDAIHELGAMTNSLPTSGNADGNFPQTYGDGRITAGGGLVYVEAGNGGMRTDCPGASRIAAAAR